MHGALVGLTTPYFRVQDPRQCGSHTMQGTAVLFTVAAQSNVSPYWFHVGVVPHYSGSQSNVSP